jgi:3'-phosphoadenosine 5'-phosphosulfate sulfotransferase (PAPS reductase)/FAD synthetase
MEELPICSVSGGKDSTALYLLMMEYFGNNFLPIFSDTGHEHPVTLNYVRNLHMMTGGPKVEIVKPDFKTPIKIRRQSRISDVRKHDRGSESYQKALAWARKMKPSGNSFLDMMIWKNAVPTGKIQFCTEHLKLWPIKFHLEKNHPDKKWIMFRGLRSAESKERASKQPFSFHGFYDCEDVLPILYETSEWVFEFLESKGVPPNPLYALGNDRVGCFPCIHANKDQLMLLPDWAWDRLEWFEKVLGISWFNGETVAQVRDWCRTSYGGKQFNMFRQAPADAPSCMTDWSYCE